MNDIQKELSREEQCIVSFNRAIELDGGNFGYWYKELRKAERRIAELEKQRVAKEKHDNALNDLANSI